MDLAAPFLRHVRERDLLPAGSGVVVACSGGADSTALALLVAGAAAELALASVTIAHLDHGLRDDSPADLAAVRALAEQLGLAFVGRREAVAQGPGESPEEAARRVRYAFLVAVAAERGASHVLTAHHADDQAETVLLRALRGTGPAGLAGIRERRPLAPGVTLVRPLLPFRREELRDALRALGRSWREDPTNEGGNDRARLRGQGLPALAACLGRDPVPPLARLARNAADAVVPDADAIADAFVVAGDDGLRVLPGFERLPRELRIDALRRHAPRLRGDAPLARDEVVRLLRALDGDASGTVTGLAVELGDSLRVVPASDAAADEAPEERAVAVPGTTGAWDGTRIVVELAEAGNAPFLARLAARDGRTEIADADRLRGLLRLRARRAGDRVQPLGAPGEAQLGHVLQRRGVPAARRDRVPLLCDDEGIVWVAGVCLADRVRVREATRSVALLRLEG